MDNLSRHGDPNSSHTNKYMDRKYNPLKSLLSGESERVKEGNETTSIKDNEKAILKRELKKSNFEEEKITKLLSEFNKLVNNREELKNLNKDKILLKNDLKRSIIDLKDNYSDLIEELKKKAGTDQNLEYNRVLEAFKDKLDDNRVAEFTRKYALFDQSKKDLEKIREKKLEIMEDLLSEFKSKINGGLSEIKVVGEGESPLTLGDHGSGQANDGIQSPSRSESKNALLHELKKPLELIYRANQTVSSLEATLKKYQETLDAINPSADSSQTKETTGKINKIKKKMEEMEKKKGEINAKLDKYKTIYKEKIESYKNSHGITDKNLNLENLIGHHDETYKKNNYKSKIELLKSIFKDFIDVFKINKISKIDISKIKKRAQSADTTRSADNNVNSEQINTHDTVKKVETELRSLTRRTSGESLKDLGKHSARLLWEILKSIGKGVKGLPKRFGRAMIYEWDNHKKRGAGLVAATVVGSLVPGVAAIAPFILPGYYGYRMTTYDHEKLMNKKYGEPAKQSAERILVHEATGTKIYIPKKKARPREISYLIRHEAEKLKKEGTLNDENRERYKISSSEVKSLLSKENPPEEINGWKVESNESSQPATKEDLKNLEKLLTDKRNPDQQQS